MDVVSLRLALADDVARMEAGVACLGIMVAVVSRWGWNPPAEDAELARQAATVLGVLRR